LSRSALGNSGGGGGGRDGLALVAEATLVVESKAITVPVLLILGGVVVGVIL